MKIKYTLSLKRGELIKVFLPDLKSSNLLLRSFEIKGENKAIDFKLIGKDTILSYGEAVFYQHTQFDLTDKVSQIIEAERLSVSIKNQCTSKDVQNLNLVVEFDYQPYNDANIIFNQLYTNLTTEGLSNILGDLVHCGKHVTKIIGPVQIG